MAILTRKSPVARGFLFLAMAIAWPALPPVFAADTPPLQPTAICEADYGGRAETLLLQPTTDVYATQSVTLGKRFRFQAQYLSERGKLKTWVYELRERGPVPLHAAEYPLPADACHAARPGSSVDNRMTDFGLNKVYSSDFERELFFRCTSTCE